VQGELPSEHSANGLASNSDRITLPNTNGRTCMVSFLKQLLSLDLEAEFYPSAGDHKAHGFYADGSQSNGTSLGFWTVFSNMEGYTGGPLRSDLVVDTNLYNCERWMWRGCSIRISIQQTLLLHRLCFEPPRIRDPQPDVWFR